MSNGRLAIRPIEDRPEAAQLLAEWFVEEWPEYHRGRSLPDVASRFRLAEGFQQTLIAELDDEVVGTVALRGSSEAAPEIPPPWLGGLFVSPTHRDRGIGQALVAAAVELAAKEGYETVHVSVRVDPSSYIRRGWRMVGTVFAGDENVTVLRIDTAA